jgi:thiol:disulfide interchange protein DsbC
MLKKMLKMSILSATLLVGANATTVNTKAMENLPILKNNNVVVSDTLDLGDVILVKSVAGANKQPFNFYISKDYKVIVMGQGLNTATAAPIKFPISSKMVEGKESFSYGAGPEVLYVFTDPDCPYCKKFEKIMPALKDKYTFKIFLLALPMHPKSPAMIDYILNADNGTESFSKLLEISNGVTNYNNNKMSVKKEAKIKQIVETAKSVSANIGLEGTPTVLDKNMKMVRWDLLK